MSGKSEGASSLETMAGLIEPKMLLVAEPVDFHLAPVH
jgi:hypothetical protein